MNLFGKKSTVSSNVRELTQTENKLLFSFGKIFLEECKTEFSKNETLHKVGQTLYLNVYEKIHEPLGFNWEPSIECMLRLVGYPHNLKLPMVEVTDIKIQTLLHAEAVERFISNVANESHLLYDSFKQSFKMFLTNWGSINKDVKRNHLLYYEVCFKPLNFEFTPVWGLYEGSFLNETDAITSIVLYEKEQHLKEKLLKIKNELEKHQEKIKEYIRFH